MRCTCPPGPSPPAAPPVRDTMPPDLVLPPVAVDDDAPAVKIKWPPNVLAAVDDVCPAVTVTDPPAAASPVPTVAVMAPPFPVDDAAPVVTVTLPESSAVASPLVKDNAPLVPDTLSAVMSAIFPDVVADPVPLTTDT